MPDQPPFSKTGEIDPPFFDWKQPPGYWSPDLFDAVRFYLEQNPPRININNIQGFGSLLAQQDTVDAVENTSSTSFTDLTTPGPSVTDIKDGFYVVHFGATMAATGGDGTETVEMGLSVDGSTPTTDAGAESAYTSAVSVSKAVFVSLSGGTSHTITAKYKGTDGGDQGDFGYRWLIVTRGS